MMGSRSVVPRGQVWRSRSKKLAVEEDGYHWLKYGEKQLVNPQRIRAYFKCAHHKVTSCQVKKLVDFQGGFPGAPLTILSSIHTGAHNHKAERGGRAKCTVVHAPPPLECASACTRARVESSPLSPESSSPQPSLSMDSPPPQRSPPSPESSALQPPTLSPGTPGPGGGNSHRMGTGSLDSSMHHTPGSPITPKRQASPALPHGAQRGDPTSAATSLTLKECQTGIASLKGCQSGTPPDPPYGTHTSIPIHALASVAHPCAALSAPSSAEEASIGTSSPNNSPSCNITPYRPVAPQSRHHHLAPTAGYHVLLEPVKGGNGLSQPSAWTPLSPQGQPCIPNGSQTITTSTMPQVFCDTPDSSATSRRHPTGHLGPLTTPSSQLLPGWATHQVQQPPSPACSLAHPYQGASALPSPAHAIHSQRWAPPCSPVKRLRNQRRRAKDIPCALKVGPCTSTAGVSISVDAPQCSSPVQSTQAASDQEIPSLTYSQGVDAQNPLVTSSTSWLVQGAEPWLLAAHGLPTSQPQSGATFPAEDSGGWAAGMSAVHALETGTSNALAVSDKEADHSGGSPSAHGLHITNNQGVAPLVSNGHTASAMRAHLGVAGQGLNPGTSPVELVQGLPQELLDAPLGLAELPSLEEILCDWSGMSDLQGDPINGGLEQVAQLSCF